MVESITLQMEQPQPCDRPYRITELIMAELIAA